MEKLKLKLSISSSKMILQEKQRLFDYLIAKDPTNYAHWLYS